MDGSSTTEKRERQRKVKFLHINFNRQAYTGKKANSK